MSTNTLFQPFSFKGLKLPNRIVMAPMTRGFSPDGYPTKDVADYYAKRAAVEVGLIISEEQASHDPHRSTVLIFPASTVSRNLLAGSKSLMQSTLLEDR